MHFRDIIAVDREPHHRMTPTLGQQDTTHLWIGAFAILIAAAPKGHRIGWRIRGVKDAAIDGHEPIATKEGSRHAFWLGNQLTALVHHRLQALAAQGLAPSTDA